MDNGTTAIQVSPITEDDMSKVQAILRRAADAIVGMSQLHADVDMLRQTVASLQADADRLRNQNNALDEALTHSRTVRDDQASTIIRLSSQIDTITYDRDDLKKANEYTTTMNGQLADKLKQVEADRDDHGFRVLELEDKLKAAEAKLSRLAQAHADVFGAMQPTTPGPAPSNTIKEFHPIQEAGEPDKPSLPTRTYHGLSWSPGYMWDNDKQEYYTEA